MEQVFNDLIDRIRTTLDLKTIFGARHRPKRGSKAKTPREEMVFERPAYDLIIFKLHFGKLNLKLYTKGVHTLRIEVIIYHTKALPFGRSLPNFPRLAAHLQQILDRFLQQLHCLDRAFISDQTLDQIHTPSQVGQSRVGGINLDRPRIRAVIEGVMSLVAQLTGRL